jgi:hypothetical protein
MALSGPNNTNQRQFLERVAFNNRPVVIRDVAESAGGGPHCPLSIIVASGQG